MVHENVENAFDAVQNLPDLQYQHLLNVNCGGNARARHIWQTVRPDLAALAVEDVDNLTKEAIGHMPPKNALSNEQVEISASDRCDTPDLGTGKQRKR